MSTEFVVEFHILSLLGHLQKNRNRPVPENCPIRSFFVISDCSCGTIQGAVQVRVGCMQERTPPFLALNAHVDPRDFLLLTT